MVGVLARFGAAEMDTTLRGGVVGDKRAFAAVQGNAFADEFSVSAIQWISSSSRPAARQAPLAGFNP